METSKNPNSKKIGFKSFENPTLPATIDEEVVSSLVPEVSISPAQADLLETIKNLSELIIDVQFVSLSETQRNNLVKQLVNASALNSELTMKTNLILSIVR